MAKARWKGDDLWYLLNKPTSFLLKRYPQYTKGTLKGKRSYWKKKIDSGQITMPPPPNDKEQDMEQEGKLYKTWEVSAFNRETNEWETATNHAYAHDHAEDYEKYQAVPAKITPSRAKPKQQEHDDIFVFTDTQIAFRRIDDELIPVHDERKMRTARNIARVIRPDLIVNLSDTIDLAELGKFDADSDHFFRTLAPSFQAVHNMYAEYRADHPDAKIVEVSSNHNERLRKYVLKYASPFYGVTRAGEEDYPVMSYPYLANLKHVNVEWIGGYPSGEYIHGEEYGVPIAFRHGTETNSKTASAASKTMANHRETHNVQGHAHNDSEAWHTLRDGTQVGSFVLGALCKQTGEVPSYGSAINDHNRVVARQENWTSSVMHIRDFRNGDYEFNRIIINPDATAYYEGKKYGSD